MSLLASSCQLCWEFVETAEQPAFPRLHHCDGMQGYFFSRPLAAEQFTGILRGKQRISG